MSEDQPITHHLQIIMSGRTLFDAVVSKCEVVTHMPDGFDHPVRVELKAETQP